MMKDELIHKRAVELARSTSTTKSCNLWLMLIMLQALHLLSSMFRVAAGSR